MLKKKLSRYICNLQGDFLAHDVELPKLEKGIIHKLRRQFLYILTLAHWWIILLKGSFINHVDSKGGRGFLKKPCLSTRGERVLEVGPRGQNFSYTTAPECCMYCCVNLVFSFEQLH